jgi:CubicO group peptidase (beta-lactamase class C family)
MITTTGLRALVAFGTAALVVAAAGCTSGGAQTPLATVSVGGRQVDPGLAASVDAFFGDDLAGSYRNRRSLLVVVGGQTVIERHDAGSTPAATYNVQSAGKSILSTLVGIAVGEGRLRLDATLGRLLPAYRPVMSAGVAAVTLRQLLTMTGGLPPDYYAKVFGPGIAPDIDWVRTILTAGQDRPAGRFQYSNGGAHLIAAILRRAVGPLLGYARKKLFTPLGIKTTPALEGVARPEVIPAYDAAVFAWPTDPQGINIGGGGQKLTASDLDKLGRLWLADGRWQGRQIVPAAWLAQATTQQVPVGAENGTDYGYGYLFWTLTQGGHRAFAALGLGGQVVEVVPDLELVVVIQSTSPSDPTVSADLGAADESDYVKIIRDLIIPHIH